MDQPLPPTRPAQRQNTASALLRFALDNKKWWLIPILLVFLLLIAIAVLSATGVAPVMYTLF